MPSLPAAALPAAAGDQQPGRHVPGEEGLWVLVFGDLTIFAAFFATYLYYRGRQPGLFAHSQLELSRGFGLANTVVLLTSSLVVCLGVQAARHRSPRRARRLFSAGLALGLCFVALKGVEWGLKLRAGVNPGTNQFFMYYFVLTGLHLFHVVIGIAVLSYLAVQGGRLPLTPRRFSFIEGGACFWHLVDLLWLVLFPLLYLVR